MGCASPTVQLMLSFVTILCGCVSAGNQERHLKVFSLLATKDDVTSR